MMSVSSAQGNAVILLPILGNRKVNVQQFPQIPTATIGDVIQPINVMVLDSFIFICWITHCARLVGPWVPAVTQNSTLHFWRLPPVTNALLIMQTHGRMARLSWLKLTASSKPAVTVYL